MSDMEKDEADCLLDVLASMTRMMGHDGQGGGHLINELLEKHDPKVVCDWLGIILFSAVLQGAKALEVSTVQFWQLLSTDMMDWYSKESD